MKAISEICVLLRNGKSVRQSSDAGGLPITRIETIADGTINPDRVGFANLLESECPDWLLQNGDILISHINSIKHLGKCAIYHGDPPALVHGMNLLVMRVDKNLASSRYVYRMLSSPGFRNQLPRITKDSVNQSSFNLSNFKNLQIPLPPLSEQKRIAGILDAADALRAKRREAIALLDTLLQSTFLEMFGDPVTNPMGWEMGVIGDLLKSATYGTSKKADPVNGSYPILRMNNITYSGEWDFRNLKYIDLDDKDLPKHLVYKGEILFNRTNSKKLVGKTAVFRKDMPMAFAGYLVRGVVNESSDPEYIGAFMNTPQTKKFLRSKCKSIVGMANINAKEFQNIPITKPPLDLQHRFATIVESVERQKASQRVHLAELDTLFASLQQRAFNGELST